MRTTLRGLVTVAMVITTVGAAHRAFALDDAATLRCEASVMKAEARFFGCASHCQERADFRTAAGVDYDQARCDDRCERQYDDTVSRSRCAATLPDRMAAPESAGLDAHTLACREIAGALESKLLRCVAHCADMVESSLQHGTVFDPQTCVDGCTENDAAAVARAEARGDCVLSDPDAL